MFVGNGFISELKAKFLVNKHTGQFFEDVLDRGHQVTCFQFHKAMVEDEGLNNLFLDSNIDVKTVKMWESNKYTKLYSYFKLLLSAAVAIPKYDFVYIFYPGNVPYLMIALCIVLRKNYGLYVRGQHDIESRMGRIFISRAHFCLTVSPLLGERIALANENVSTIAPMMDFDLTDILESKPTRHDRPLMRCIFVGRVERRKGIYEFADAIIALDNADVYFEYDIVGGGEDLEDVRRILEGVAGVRFHGQVGDSTLLKQLYHSSDILIFPSHDEGFPRVLYEAMMYRVLVITTMVGGISAVMQSEYNCLGIQPKASQTIYDRLVEISAAGYRADRLLDNGTDTVKEIFGGSRRPHIELFCREIADLGK